MLPLADFIRPFALNLLSHSFDKSCVTWNMECSGTRIGNEEGGICHMPEIVVHISRCVMTNFFLLHFLLQ